MGEESKRDPELDKELIKVFSMYRRVAKTIGHPCRGYYKSSIEPEDLNIPCMDSGFYIGFSVADVLRELLRQADTAVEDVPRKIALMPPEWDVSIWSFLQRINYQAKINLGHKWAKEWAWKITQKCPKHMAKLPYMWNHRLGKVMTKEDYEGQYLDEKNRKEKLVADTETLKKLWKDKEDLVIHRLRLWGAELRMRAVYGEPPKVDETWVE